MFSRLKLSLMCVLIFCGAAWAESLHTFRLPNGLTVYVVQDPNAPLATVRTYVRAGSVFEGGLLGSGVSHYLEHLVAGGSTKLHPEGYYDSAIAKMGGAFNAYTTYDLTAYYIDTTPEHVPAAIETMSDWMFHCVFVEAEVAREREVIHKEMERSKASVDAVFFEHAQTDFYQAHPLRYPVIGYRDKFDALSASDIQGYYRDRYVPSNMVLVIGGNVTVASVNAKVAETFGKEPFRSPPAGLFLDEPLPATRRQDVHFGQTQLTHISLRFSTTSLFSEDLYPLDLLAYVLGHGEKSVLYERLVSQKGLATDVECSSYTPTVGTGYFEISFQAVSKNVELCIAEAEKLVAELRSSSLPKERLDRAKQQKLAELTLGLKTIQDKVESVGRSTIQTRSPDFDQVYASRFRFVSAGDLQKVATRYLNLDKVVVTELAPLEEQGPRLVSATGSGSGSANVEKITLSNGVRVLLMPDKSAGYVSTLVMVLGGVRAETPKQNGIGTLSARLMGRGSQGSNVDFRQLVESHGATAGAAIGQNTFYFSMECLAEHNDELQADFFKSYLAPRFDAAAFDEEKRLLLSDIETRKDSWSKQAFFEAKKRFFGAHPYGLPEEGVTKSVNLLTESDVRNYYQTLRNANDTVVAVAGNFDPDVVKKRIASQFNVLSPSTQFSDFPLSSKRVHHVAPATYDLTLNQDVAVLVMLFDGVSYVNRDTMVKLDLLDSVLSGMRYPGGRLHNRLRGEGAVYVVHATQAAGFEDGYFIIYALTSPDRVQDVERIIREEIQALKTKPLYPDELANAKSQVVYDYLAQQSPLSSKLFVASAYELVGLGYTAMDSRIKTVNQLKAKDVQEMAGQYLQNPQVFVFNRGK